MKDLMRDDLQSVLKRDVPDLIGKTIVIWGIGNMAQLYFEGICRLKEKLKMG